MTDVTKLRRYSVLVVDDNEMNRELLQRRLEQMGYLVSTAVDGRQALELMQCEAYDLVMLDIMMPEMDGFAVLQEMKKRDRLTVMPVMMVTAINDMENVVRCVNLGAKDYITKPFDPTLLKTRVTRLLEKVVNTRGQERESSLDRKGVRLLVVDDNEMNRDVLSGQLSRFGYQVALAASGKEGLAKAMMGGFNCILLDVMMPEMDGFAVLEQLKAATKTKDTPVIMVSANDDPATIERCTQLGAHDYVTKPFNAILLNVRVANALGVGASDRAVTGDAVKPVLASDALKRALVAEVRKKMLSNSLELPVNSDMAITVTQLAMQANVSIGEIAKVIKLEPSITATLISIANSNLYRGLSKAATLEDAITRLGINETKRYVVTMANKLAYKANSGVAGKLVEQTWQHALAVAQAAKALAVKLNLPDRENFYTLGLMHDIGVSVIANAIGMYAATGQDIGRDLALQIVDELHEEVGAYLVRRWQLSQALEAVIGNHHFRSKSVTERDSRILALAEAIAAELGFTMGEAPLSADQLQGFMKAENIGVADWNALRTEIEQELRKVKSVL